MQFQKKKRKKHPNRFCFLVENSRLILKIMEMQWIAKTTLKKKTNLKDLHCVISSLTYRGLVITWSSRQGLIWKKGSTDKARLEAPEAVSWAPGSGEIEGRSEEAHQTVLQPEGGTGRENNADFVGWRNEWKVNAGIWYRQLEIERKGIEKWPGWAAPFSCPYSLSLILGMTS